MIRVCENLVDFGMAGLMTGLLLLSSCAIGGAPPLPKVPPNGQKMPKAEEVATPRLPAGPEVAPPEEAPIPAVKTVPVLKGPGAEAKPTEGAPLSQEARASEVAGGLIRVIDVGLQDVGPTFATVLIKSDKPILNYESFTLPDPPRLIINIEEAIHAVPKRVEALAGGPIQKIRSSQYRREKVQIVRLVLELASNLPYLPHLPYRIKAAPGPLQIVIGEAVTKAAANSVVNAEGRNARVLEKPVSLPGLSKRTTLDLKQMDILAVLKFVAEQSDLNIVPGKNVGGRVTLSLKAVTIQDALDIIALNHELAYVVQNGVIHVMTEADYQRLFGSSFADQRQVKTLYLQYADVTNVATVLGSIKSAVGRVVADGQTRTVVLIDVPEKLQQMVAAVESMDRATQLETQIFELKYGKAVDIKAEVEKALTPKLGAVRVDKRTNTLAVTDLLPHLQEIRRIINAFDRKTREVIIEAKIIEVRLADRFQMGVDWEVLLKNAKDLDLKHTFPITPPLSSFGKITVGTLDKDKFKVVLEFLQTVGKTNILSTPQIAVVENEEAKILVGTREAFVTSAVTQTAQAATTAEQITFVDVGLQLRVTPIINAEGFVTMKIKPEVSSVNRFLETASKNQIPIVETSTAETTVMVKDGITIVIAGLMKDETVNATKKVPILGDIPILGAAFRSKDERVAKTELIFFLTPSLISGQESVAGVPSP